MKLSYLSLLLEEWQSPAYRAALEKQWAFTRPGGSNPSSSAMENKLKSNERWFIPVAIVLLGLMLFWIERIITHL